MAEPLFHEAAVVVGIAAIGGHREEAIGTRGAAEAIAFLEEAQARINHVLAFEMRRLRDGEEVLRVAALGAAECADVAGTPRLFGQPLAGVVAVFELAPAEGAIANPSAFREVGAAEID